MKENACEEQLFLDHSLTVIDKEISKLQKICQDEIDLVQELSKYHWERKSEMDEIEEAVSRNDVNHTATLTNNQLSKLRKLRKASDNPFFGKIKVDFDGEKESFYIGLTSILDNNDLIINDWRSPIANLFYNSRLGNTSYKVPNGMISCNLLQREQIKIINREIKRIINSDIHLTDDVLQEVLSKSSTDKMKSIINTIQEEQNDVIRNLKDSKIIVQGCAGSGKTSVALHRLSYLLYNDKNSNSENMLIFSPSDAFSSYISNVLPDLGDDNVLQTTFSDFANSFINRFDKLETFVEFIGNYYDNNNDKDENDENRFKCSYEFIETIDKFIQNYVNKYRFEDDVVVANYSIPGSYLNKILDNDTTSSLQGKIDILTDEVYSLLVKKSEIKKSSIRATICKELIKPSFDPRATYNKFLNSEEYINAFGKKGTGLNKKMLKYPDIVGMLYLNFEFMGYPKNNIIHHLVIDEAQDYMPLQMKMISKMFSGATVTALGDINQTINPYFKYNSLEDMKKYLGNSAKYIELNKAYRSSPEIMNYVKNIVDDKDIISVRKSQEVPVGIKEVDKKDLFNNLVNDIINLKNNNMNRICIITKSSKEAKAIYEGLKDCIDGIEVLTENNNGDLTTVISPSFVAKGLEFDAIICYNDYDNPYKEEDKYLYYVACTRAQHDLLIYNEPKELKKVSDKNDRFKRV